ncbi:hypothetical protein [Rhizobium oryzicola]|uniref:Uncharacterized protein n=1 Tax=Rhizobium oryzicola TaxID=1232668 RepID=A0ABT8SR37_9HYPH|nr:hypothetical protein [Rhizobium oryzicola]MDO1580900.1 hypothetical protein [Rhizobium oryzicola]
MRAPTCVNGVRELEEIQFAVGYRGPQIAHQLYDLLEALTALCPVNAVSFNEVQSLDYCHCQLPLARVEAYGGELSRPLAGGES